MIEGVGIESGHAAAAAAHPHRRPFYINAISSSLQLTFDEASPAGGGATRDDRK